MEHVWPGYPKQSLPSDSDKGALDKRCDFLNDPWSRQRAAEAGADAFAEKGLGWAVLIGQIRKSITLRRQDGTRAG